jgi:hypothetical protein
MIKFNKLKLKKTKDKTGENSELVKSIPLARLALSQYRQWWKSLVLIALTVGVPVAIASAFLVDPSSDSTLAAYLTFAQLTMSAALVFAIMHRRSGTTSISVRRAYYDSSFVLVRLVLFTMLMGVLSLPLLFGLLVVAYGVVAPGVAAAFGEQLLMILLSLLIIVPSIALLVRSGWGWYMLFEGGLGPIEVLRESWRLTAKRTAAVTLRLMGLIGFLVVVMVIPTVGLLGLQVWLNLSIFSIILQIVFAMVALPLANLYLIELYNRLKK